MHRLIAWNKGMKYLPSKPILTVYRGYNSLKYDELRPNTPQYDSDTYRYSSEKTENDQLKQAT